METVQQIAADLSTLQIGFAEGHVTSLEVQERLNLIKRNTLALEENFSPKEDIILGYRKDMKLKYPVTLRQKSQVIEALKE